MLTTPVFGRDVVYDCPNAKLMEQKKVMATNASFPLLAAMQAARTNWWYSS